MRKDNRLYAAIRVLLEHPSSLLLSMTLWWVMPLFIMNLFFFPSTTNLPSNALLVVIIAMAALTAFVFNYVMSIKGIWAASENWKRYYYLGGAYVVQMMITVIVVLLYDGADQGGSVISLFFPSLLGYFIIGVVMKWNMRLTREKTTS